MTCRSARVLPLLVALLSLLCACATGDVRPSTPPSSTEAVKLTYRGPSVEAALQQEATLHVVLVTVQAPTGGYSLRLDETRRTSKGTEIYLTLESPGPDEMATMALEEHREKVVLKPEQGAVHVYVKQVQRNITYVQTPPYELAQALTRS